MTLHGSLYRPGSGTEGIWFMDRFCGRCRRDQAFREDLGDSCPIAAATMIYGPRDPEYPREWVHGDFGPECTAYEPMTNDGMVLDVRQMPLPLVQAPHDVIAGGKRG